MPHRRSRNTPHTISNSFKLPFAARWGDLTLRPGAYDLFLVETEPAPVVVIRGMGTTAIVAPSQVDRRGAARLSTLFLSPGFEPPHVQLLRLAPSGLCLRFQDCLPCDAQPGVLALPLRERAAGGSHCA